MSPGDFDTFGTADMSPHIPASQRQGDIFHESDMRTAAERKISERAIELGEVRAALLAVMDCVDYTAPQPACRQTEAVGAVLPVSVLQLARKALRRRE